MVKIEEIKKRKKKRHYKYQFAKKNKRELHELLSEPDNSQYLDAIQTYK